MAEQEFIPAKAESALAVMDMMAIPGTQFSIAPALEIAAQLAPFETNIANLEAQAERAVVTSQESMQRAVEFCSIADGQRSQLETFRKATTGPVYDYWKYMNAMFQPLIARAEAASKKVSKLAVAFKQQEEERERQRQAEIQRRQEEEALKLAQQRESAGDTAGAQAIVEAATMAPPPRPAPRMTMTSTSGRAFVTRKAWVGKVEKPMDVLKAIVEGKLPISLIGEWSQSELNKFAKATSVAGVFCGVKVAQEETGGTRG